jgi:hypothetical protein
MSEEFEKDLRSLLQVNAELLAPHPDPSLRTDEYWRKKHGQIDVFRESKEAFIKRYGSPQTVDCPY